MSQKRSYTCGGCHGIVAVPKGRRNITIQKVKENHEHTCPSRRAK